MINSIKSKKTISIILTIILLLFTTSVYAANDSFNTSLSVNKSSVEQGENVIVTINISDISIESGEKGIGAYTAKLEFDSSVLEYVETNGTDKWEAPFYQDKQITGTTADGKVVDTNQNIGTITFKVKENAPVGETTIKLTNFSGSTAETDVSSEDSTIELTIVAKEGGSGDETENGNGSTSGNTNGSGSGNASGNTNGSGNTSGSTNGSTNGSGSGSKNSGGNIASLWDDIKEGRLPATGYSNIVIYALIIIFSLIAIRFGLKIIIINMKTKKSKH